jgi:hypothetical protein
MQERKDAYIPEDQFDPTLLVQFAEQLAPYDPVDLLAAAGGLQLLPENAHRAIRLEVLAHVIASLEDQQPNRPYASRHRLSQWCNTGILGQGWVAAQEDPFDNPFLEALPFYNGNFLVFPGISDESTLVLRLLCRALFADADAFSDPLYVREARELLSAVLALSNEVATRAGLVRGVEIPPWEKGRAVFIPDARMLATLKEAVTFHPSALTRLLEEHLTSPAVLDQLTLPLGLLALSEYELDMGALRSRPLVRADDALIVALPGMLPVAARHALIRRALERGVGEELARSYREAVWEHLVESLATLNHEQDLYRPPGTLSIPSSQDAFFSLDSDKMMYTLLITDPLTEYDASDPFGEWSLRSLESLIEARLHEMQDHLFGLDPSPSDLLFLVVLQGVGRPGRFLLPHSERLVLPPLGLSAGDLRTIVWLEEYDRLVLWKLAKASWKVRARAAVQVFSQLDEFAAYRAHDYSYTLPEEERPSFIYIPPGGAGELRREVARQLDQHAVRAYIEPYVADVITAHETRTIPIYTALNDRRLRASMLVELLPLPVWIVGSPFVDNEQGSWSDLSADCAGAIAYWFWQFTPSLSPYMQPLAARYSRLRVQLSLSAPDQWFLTPSQEKLSAESPFSLQVDAATGTLHLILAAATKELIERADNSGERNLMLMILQGVRELLPEEERVSFSDEVIATILDRHAPLGRKKMLLSLSVNQNPDLDVRGLLPFRKVQAADLQELLDELADDLTFVKHLSPGPIPEQEKTALLDKAVAFFYHELVQLVTSLDAEGLLEFLIRFQESIVRQTAFHRLSIPARLECFRSQPQMVRHLVEEGPELATAATASRFVIEYVAACPPHGHRKMSLSVYDRLQALAAHIIYFGVARDLLTLQVADIGLDISPSGRLVVDREQYDRALAGYLSVVTAHAFSEAIRDFGQHWQRDVDTAHDVKLWARIDAATNKEFGSSMTDLQTLLATAWIISEDLDPGVVCLPLEKFLDRLAARLGWAHEHIQGTLELLSLVPRQDFLVPPTPYKPAEVYPWRFNRQLSYLRRPFVWRERNGSIEVLWGNRHLYRSMFYLNELCFSGRLSAQARTPEMQRLMSHFLNQRGEEFNDKVADFFTQHVGTGVIVERRVKAIGELSKHKGPPGDIDVLIIDPGKRRVWVIECKDFTAAHMPHQIANELEKLFLGKGGKESKVERRARWVRENLDSILEWFKVGGRGKWKVEPFIVVSQELFTPYLRRSPIRILSFDALLREGERGHPLEPF